jgi:hypothetical protein
VPAGKSKGRTWIRRLCIATLVLGLMAAAVLVPISQIIGFNKKLPAQYKLLQPPAASHRVMFAFSGNTTVPAPRGLLPVELAAAVLQWTVLASSRVHVATFSSRPAMQQAMALLANATDLKYAVADFRLLQDSAVSTVIDPGQLFDLSRLPTRQLLQQQQQQQTRSNQAPELAEAVIQGPSSSSYYRAAQASKLLATHRQRLAQRKAKRRQLLLQRPALASIGLPATARGVFEQQRQHWVVDAAEPRQQASAAPGTWPLQPSGVTTAASESSISLQQQQQPPEAGLVGSTICAEHGLQGNAIGDHSYSSSWANSYACGSGTTAAVAAKPSAMEVSTAGNADERQHHQQRRLQQLPSLPVAPNPQPQQTQAKQHVQKGGQGVAWHLTAAGLDVKPAWNKTYGKWCTGALHRSLLCILYRICTASHLPAWTCITLHHALCARSCRSASADCGPYALAWFHLCCFTPGTLSDNLQSIYACTQRNSTPCCLHTCRT